MPLLIISVSSLIIFSLNFYNNKKQLQETALSSLNQLAYSSEEKISAAIESANNLFSNATVVSHLNSSITDDYVSIKATNKILKNLKNNTAAIDSAFILGQNDEFIINENNNYSFSDFFTNEYVYEAYPYSYWKSFRFFNSADFTILAPTVVVTNDSEKNIIPIVIRAANEIRAKNFLVININLNSLLSANTTKLLTENSNIFFLNKFTMKTFSLEREIGTLEETDELYKKLVSGSNMFDINLPGYGKTTVISHSVSGNISGYVYYAIIPLSDIISKILPNIYINVIIIMLFTVLAVLIAFRNAEKVVSPIQQLAKTLIPDQDFSMHQLNLSAINLKKNNSDLSALLPFAQERYLINYLNSTDYSMDESARKIIQSSLPFKFEYFAVVIFQLSPTFRLYDEYTATEYSNVQSGFYNIVKDIFVRKFDSLVLSSINDMLYIIINAPSSDNDTQITELINQICNLLKNDIDYIKLSYGKSEFHQKLAGLKTAYEEATSSLTMFTLSDNQKFSPAANTEINFVFSDSDESELFNALVNFKIDKAIEIFDTVISNNQSSSNRSKRQLYTQILNTIFKAMRLKKFQYTTDNLDLELFSDILSKPLPEVEKEILNLFEYIHKYSENHSSELIQSIIEYIDEHFSDPDLSLDSLSSVFNVRTSYISTAISTNINMGFHKYLTSLRIANAKKLLSNSSKNIEEIYMECGFTSQPTFYRVFKKLVGTSPLEYRKSQTKK